MAKFKLYKDNAGEWRWRLVGKNGRIIADGAEGYATRNNAKQALKRFTMLAAQAEIVESADINEL